MAVQGVVREWHPDDGWGVIDSDGTPGGCWAHFSVVEMEGYKALSAGDPVELTWETPGQDGYDHRATRVVPLVRMDACRSTPSS